MSIRPLILALVLAVPAGAHARSSSTTARSS
jgi:hypothetical protein